MTLVSGTRLGVYEIRSAIGAGGMGEVYRARDTKLGRDVAIKVLPASSTADGPARAVPARSARLLASLHHPDIGAIYGVGIRRHHGARAGTRGRGPKGTGLLQAGGIVERIASS